MSSLPPEKLAELRQVVHTYVSESGVQEEIRGCLSEILAQEGGRTLHEEELLHALQERGLIDKVMGTLNLSGVELSEDGKGEGVRSGWVMGDGGYVESAKTSDFKDTEHLQSPWQSKSPRRSTKPEDHSHLPQKRRLFLQVVGGRAFLDHLADSDSTCHQCHSTFTLHVHFRGQRYHSKPVPCACEPNFKEGFLLELAKRASGLLSYTDALSMSDQIHIVLTRTNGRGERELVGTSYLQWRQILCETSGKASLSIELSGIGTEAKIPAGILDFQLEILPKSNEPINLEILTAQLALEKQRRAEKERMFLVYAKQWWKEYLQIRQAHSQRLVKIFAPDEVGVNHPVCAYVRPLRAGRLLDSPRHAARFVSLIPFEKASGVGSSGSSSEMWCGLHSMLAQKKGDTESHAVLLCSLLLGFGLDACVCIGTKSKGLAHAWVMTIGHECTVTFWESITGQRYIHPKFDPNTQAGRPLPLPTHPYRTIGCVFNNRAFYANTQPSDAVTTCRFELHNGTLWKSMSPEAIQSVVGVGGGDGRGMFPPLLPGRVDSVLASNEMELQLRELTVQHREDLGLNTVWDDELCYLLNPALTAYETERCLGVGGVGNEEFQEAIRNVVPDGYTFKGFPIQLLHRQPRKAFTACLQSPVCSEILGCKAGDHVRLAVRVRVFTYPEDVCAVWVMLAVKYRSIL